MVDEEVVSLTILADGVGERSQPPGFGSLDGRLGLFEILLRLRGDALGLAGREVLAQDENSFVVGHGVSCGWSTRFGSVRSGATFSRS